MPRHPWIRRRRRAVAALAVALLAAAIAMPASAGSPVDYPDADRDYHSFAEMREEILAVEDAHPGIVDVSSIGQSVEGRQVYIAKISDNVGDLFEPGEPEVLFDALHHAREHLTPEMALYLLHLLVDRYGEDTDLGHRVTPIVNGQVTWIVFMLNPDGLVYDLSAPAKLRIYGPNGASFYAGWRKNRSDLPGTSAVGIDLNRNYGYRWGCCGGSTGTPSALTYRGPAPWAAPEVTALRDFVDSRVVDGRQRIAAHITFHAAGEQILYPYGYTFRNVPSDMTALDHRTFVRLAQEMADRNGYRPMQSSDLYVTDGDQIDWMYARHRIFSFTFEMYPGGNVIPATNRFYPADELIVDETRRNRDAVLYLLEMADCPYQAIGQAAEWCGPYFDDLEIPRGWTLDPDGTDSATNGRWTRGVAKTSPLQKTGATSGRAVLVTGRPQGADVDGGRTTIRSPLFKLPDGRTATLRLRYWVGLDAAAGPDDGLIVRLVDVQGSPLGEPLLGVGGEGTLRQPAWRKLVVQLPAETKGKRVAIQLEARDAPGDGDATVEAGVDSVRVTVE